MGCVSIINILTNNSCPGILIFLKGVVLVSYQLEYAGAVGDYILVNVVLMIFLFLL